MKNDLEDSLKILEKFLDTEEGKKFTDEFCAKYERKDARIEKVKKYLDSLNDSQFFKLMDRLVNEHDETHRENCYLNGYEPHPNNKLDLLIGFFERYGKPSRKSFGNKYFGFNTYEYRGFYVNLMYGQGTAISVWYKNNCVINL